MSKEVFTDKQINEIKQLDGIMISNHQQHNKCGSSDGASLYQKDYRGQDVIDGFCYACAKYVRPEEVGDVEPVDIEEIEQINTEKLDEIIKLPMRGWRQRKVNKATSEFYGVRSELNEDGNVLNRYYPCHNTKGDLTRYKVRNCIEKGFWSIGKKARVEQFFGQTLFPKGGKYLIIAGGEEDAMSAFQMLRSNKYMTPCISPTNGEGSVVKQLQDNFEYVTSFDTVIFMLDNDETGKESAEKAIKLLRPDQGKIWKPNYKDVNDYLVKDKEEEFKTAFFKAEHKTPAGVVGSSDSKIWDAIIERANAIKIALPSFAKELEEKLRGGPALGEITTLAAASSIGKTSLLNAFTYHWIFNAPYKVGIISLESDLGELGENLLSLHLGKKLANMYDEDKLELLDDNMKRKFLEDLGKNESGEDRYTILDHQSAIMDDELKRKIEHLVKVEDCKIIILDPLTLAMSGQSNDGMDSFNAWYLRFVKREKIAAFNVLHVRKNQGGQKANSRGAEISEEDIKGCLDKDSEVLTDKGWVKISEWGGQNVAEYEKESGMVSYKKPVSYITLPAKQMHRFSNNSSLDMVLSEEHKVLYQDRQGLTKTTTVDKLLEKGVGRKKIPTTFSNNFERLKLTDDQIRLFVMIAADGCYHGNNLCKISFSKERKVKRCEELLNACGIEYSKTSPTGRPKETVFRFKAQSQYKSLHSVADWYSASVDQLNVLLEESLLWDGTLKGKRDIYYTTVKQDADIIQFAGCCTGRSVRVHCRKYGGGGTIYEASVPKQGSSKNDTWLRSDSVVIEEYTPEDGKKYCFTTSTGFFVARRNGKVFVTGNSGSIFQTSMNIWLFMRDKNNDDPIIKNTTKVVQSKARRTGDTGTAGYWYYNNETGEFEVGQNPDDIDVDNDMKQFESMGALNNDNPDDFEY